ncbi:SnoaL-like domain protein [Symmachiella macrocystis]|uniref:SnoaL-like domain protein n=1 Tax=Symmachiella macrocystis TaxID=2527985 RepID=A0A5C6AYQ2_9PLAN|nr:SgcJ/EcaC family oxidoreductase [Symmachiella macrocystis]TWU05175.1 SnoaL-like domain protein [Symmachiella macrocystis]
MNRRRFSLLFAPICLAAGICFGISLVAIGDSPAEVGNTSQSQADVSRGDLLLAFAATKPAKPQDSGERISQKVGGDKPFAIPEVEKPFWKNAQSFVDAYSKHDAKAIGELFTEDAEFYDEFGELTEGRSAIIEMFQDVFDRNAQAMIEEIVIDRVKPISDDVVIESGKVVASDDVNGPIYRNGYVAIHKKGDDGTWRINTLKDQLRKEGNRSEQLAQLSWLIGEWVNEDRHSVVDTDCDWSEDGNFLLRRFTVQTYDGRTLNGVQRIGWDGDQKKLRSWTFDSEGGYLTGEWARDGNRWLLINSGVNSDGKAVSGTAVYTVIDAEMVTWQLQNVVVGKEITGAGPLVTMVRRPPEPEAASK